MMNRPTLSQEWLDRLVQLESQFCWTIGATMLGDCCCSIWERGRWTDEKRIVINTSAKSLDLAVEAAISKLGARILGDPNFSIGG